MAYTQELDDIAEWFLNCGMKSLTTEQIASIIRKWYPSVEAAQQSEQADGVCPECKEPYSNHHQAGGKYFCKTPRN